MRDPRRDSQHPSRCVVLTLAGPRCELCGLFVTSTAAPCECPENDERYGDWLAPLRQKYDNALKAGFTWDRWSMGELTALFHEIDRLRDQPSNTPQVPHPPSGAANRDRTAINPTTTNDTTGAT